MTNDLVGHLAFAVDVKFTVITGGMCQFLVNKQSQATLISPPPLHFEAVGSRESLTRMLGLFIYSLSHCCACLIQGQLHGKFGFFITGVGDFRRRSVEGTWGESRG